jgi:hypothetical protein
MTIYHEARKAFGESVLPAGVHVGLQLLRVSMDLTDLVRDAWAEQSWQEIEERLNILDGEYKEIEHSIVNEMTKLDKVEAEAYTTECARLCVQLEEIGAEMSDSSSSSESGEEYLGELLTRKLPSLKVEVV